MCNNGVQVFHVRSGYIFHPCPAPSSPPIRKHIEHVFFAPLSRRGVGQSVIQHYPRYIAYTMTNQIFTWAWKLVVIIIIIMSKYVANSL